MAKISLEYMELMSIKNIQFILVRHHNTDNPHCHLVYNRINYDGKVISSQNDFKPNEIATKRLKDNYGLTYAEDKSKTNVKKLHDSERVKYEIHNAEKAANFPEAMIQNIAKGRLGKYLKEVYLLNQEDVTGEDKKTVRETLKAIDAELSVIAFKRVNLNVD